jgi:tyrosyl-tRNA synthetase
MKILFRITVARIGSRHYARNRRTTLKEMTTTYIGFDPTSDSLHIGSLVPIVLLVHLKNFGHKPIALVGGATGMIGDPSGKSDERNLLDEATLNHNVEGIKGVLSRFLDFNSEEVNAPVLVNITTG